MRIFVIANATADFSNFQIDWAQGQTTEDKNFSPLYSSSNPLFDPTEVYVWEISNMQAQDVTLRLRLNSSKGTYAETFASFAIRPIKPEPTRLPPTPTPIPIIPTPEPTTGLVLMTLTPTPTP